MKKYISLIVFCAIALVLYAQQTTIKIGLLKYSGGGDWYANPTSLPNLADFCNKTLGLFISREIENVEPGSGELFNFPFVHMTGHGNVVFSNSEAKNLRKYLISGGFLHVSDNYGMDIFIRREMKKVFPELDFIELPFNHPIYHQKFSFPNGLPKIHEHDGKSAKGYGIIYQGRLVCFYDYQCDLGDGWEDQKVHKDSEDVRQNALKMGANLVQYAFTK
jgi:hypothetical protein